MSIVDTKHSLCCNLPCIELPLIDSRGQIPQPCLPSLPIVESLDVLGDLPDGLFSRLVATVMNKLILERTPEALHGGIIVAIAFPAHGCSHLELIHHLPVFMGAILTPTIRMVDQAGSRPFRCHGLEQRLAHKVLGDPIAHGISNDLSREEVLMPCQIEPAFFCGDIGNVTKPNFVRPRCLKLLME